MFAGNLPFPPHSSVVGCKLFEKALEGFVALLSTLGLCDSHAVIYQYMSRTRSAARARMSAKFGARRWCQTRNGGNLAGCSQISVPMSWAQECAIDALRAM